MMCGIDRMKISVEDTGIGIAPEKQKGIFSLFGMIQGNQVLNPQGCGLGLSISSMLVQRLGGCEIALASAPKQGSVFSFEIPIVNAETRRSSQTSMGGFEGDEIPDEYGKNSPTVMRELTGGCESGDILVVDDAPFNRLVLRKILETAGYSCVEASTGLEALDHISVSSERGTPFAVVIMDIEMPEMDGITATKHVRELAEKGILKSLPFIIGCSAFSSEDDQRIALSAGMHFYIEKPVARSTLLELVARCIRSATRS